MKRISSLMNFYCLIGLIAVVVVHSSGTDDDIYNEELVIGRLPTLNQIGYNFRFTVVSNSIHGRLWFVPNASSDTGFTVVPFTSNLFPHVIADLLRTYGVSDLSLSLTQGFYRPTHWGYAVQPHASPHGAHVRAVFDTQLDQDDDSIDLRWRDLVHALSGYFCASLSTMHPKYTSEPSPLTSSVNRSTHAERAGILSSENVCTENLTPWKKLLPCKKV